MSAPVVRKVCVPLYHRISSTLDGNASCENDDKTFVTAVFIQVVSYGDLFYWFHITEGEPVGGFGCCAMAISPHSGPVPTTLLLRGVETEVCGTTVENPEQNFCTSLTRHLVQKIKKNDGRDISVIANCSIEGEKRILLLGTEAGSGFTSSIEFGSLVFRECLRLIRVETYGRLNLN